jgi:hypothetical protein
MVRRVGHLSNAGKGTAVEDEQLELPFWSEVLPHLPCESDPVALPPENSSTQGRADRLHAALREETGVEIRLRITNNSSTMMSLRYEESGERAVVGLHHMFLDAPKPIRKALGTWIVRPRAKKAGEKLESYIAERRHLIAPAAPRNVALRTAGRHVDLQKLYDEVNAAEFDESVETPITWGRMPTKRSRRSIRFGSYSPSDELIRIHPYLDQAFVPVYFVRYIVFHEMLHAHMGIEEGPTGRRRIHPPAFRKREEAYVDFERAVSWMNDEAKLRRLLRAPRG